MSAWGEHVARESRGMTARIETMVEGMRMGAKHQGYVYV